jgi:hypothetical protein
MKVAVVFHGIRGGMKGHNGSGNPINIAECAALIKYNILSHYDCDLFIHSWSIDDEKEIKSLYNFTDSLFEKQESFGHDLSKPDLLSHPWTGQAFRTISRCASIYRALELKKKHETKHNFKYKWVVLLRLDLVFFNKLNLDRDNQVFYGCYIPEWNSLHDLMYVSNSDLMDKFGTLYIDIMNGTLSPNDAHALFINKLEKMFQHQREKYMNYIVMRYDDIEIYRCVTQPQELRPEGNAFGNLLMKDRFEALRLKLLF